MLQGARLLHEECTRSTTNRVAAILVEDPADAVGVADQLTMVLSDMGFDNRGV